MFTARTLKLVPVVRGCPGVPVCVPDWLPEVLTAVPARALAIDVATWKVFVVTELPMTQ
jgi:hypothetical protein